MVYLAWGIETVLVCMATVLARWTGAPSVFRAYLMSRLLVTVVRFSVYPDHSWLIYWPTCGVLFVIAACACWQSIVQRWYSIPAGFAVHYGAALALYHIPNYYDSIVALKLIPPILALVIWLVGESYDIGLYPQLRRAAN